MVGRGVGWVKPERRPTDRSPSRRVVLLAVMTTTPDPTEFPDHRLDMRLARGYYEAKYYCP